jgi:hypothetical protein
MPPTWAWEKTEAGRPGMSGDLAKLFRHEPLKAPGVFAKDAPPTAATLLAREVIQNSWDAAQELTEPNAPQFGIEFRFQSLVGTAKRSLTRALALESLAERANMVDRAKVGLSSSDCLTTITENDVPLKVLVISESGASGMYGVWEQNRSHMFLALLSIGFTEKPSGAGGSYGYGKAGLINGSAIRSVVAYSCFREREDEPGVTRRLLGVTYWGAHDHGGTNHPGIATFSAGSAGHIRPFDNDEADEVAQELGMQLRRAERPEDLGTTFLLIDTPIDPQQLVRAIERSWWPALHEQKFAARVVDYGGATLVPRPMQDPVLHSFIDAWEIARGRSDPGPEGRRTILPGSNSLEVAGSIGTLGLVADLSGWSYDQSQIGEGEEAVTHKSLVALTRNPMMVVEYLVTGSTPPFIRGVFIADGAIDELLRRTEPKAHDAWRTSAEPGELDPQAAELAKYVLKKIRETVSNHRTKLKPPTPPPEEVNLPFFNDVMRRVMSGTAKGVRQPVPEIRPISIQLQYEPRAASDHSGRIELVGSATYALTDHYEGESAQVLLAISYRFVEDDRVGDHAALRVTAPEGFTPTLDGAFEGKLKRERPARFDFVSEPYDLDWSGRLIVNGEVVVAAATGAAG